MAKLSGSTKLVTRLAGPDDYSAVLSITENEPIYGGGDYIPYTYRIFQQNPNCYMFLSELNGKPICFSMYNILNDGQTALSAAGRTHPKYQGMGLFGQHQENARNAILSMNLGFKEVTYTAWNEEFHQRRLQDKSLNISLVSKHPSMYYKGKREIIQRAVEKELQKHPDELRTTYQLSVEEAMAFLQDPENVTRFFSDSHFLATCQFLTLRPTQKNLNWIAKNANIVTSKPANGVRCELISHSCVLPCPAGARLAIFVHGPQMNAGHLHILLHLAHACKVFKTDILSLVLYFSSEMNVKEMHARMTNLSMTEPVDAESIIHSVQLQGSKL